MHHFKIAVEMPNARAFTRRTPLHTRWPILKAIFPGRTIHMTTRFYTEERVALFIDGANLHAAARALGFDIDYKRLLKYFQEQCRLIRAFYYTAVIEDQEYSPLRPLVDWLDYNGFTMVTKPTKE